MSILCGYCWFPYWLSFSYICRVGVSMNCLSEKCVYFCKNMSKLVNTMHVPSVPPVSLMWVLNVYSFISCVMFVGSSFIVGTLFSVLSLCI